VRTQNEKPRSDPELLVASREFIAHWSRDAILQAPAVLPLLKVDSQFLLREMPMLHRTLVAQRLIALFVLGWLLFNYPLLALFNDARTWLGLPLLYGYLFAAWALFIALIAVIVEQGASRKTPTRAVESEPASKD
jgi:hypothetical protein